MAVVLISQPELERMRRVAAVTKEGGGSEPLQRSVSPLSPAARASARFPTPSSPLAGLHPQLLPVGRLLCFRLGAGVRAPVEC